MTIWFFKYKEKDYFFSFVISFNSDDHSVTARIFVNDFLIFDSVTFFLIFSRGDAMVIQFKGNNKRKKIVFFLIFKKPYGHRTKIRKN